MAMAYVFRHASGGNNSRATGLTGNVLTNGQLLFFTGEKYPYSEGSDSGPWLHIFYHYASGGSWKQGIVQSNRKADPNPLGELVNNSGDKIYSLSQFNKAVYGGSYAYAGGSHYGLRENTYLEKVENGSWTIKLNPLFSDYRVIIGSGQGFTYSNDLNFNNFNRVRCWGYKSPSGKITETTGLYVRVKDITENPGSYAINTR